MASRIGRRKFLATLGGAAAWPLAAHSQGAPLPIVGYLAQGTPEGSVALVAAVRKGLNQVGLIEGKDFTAEFRSASNDADRLPELATDLIQRRGRRIRVGWTTSAGAVLMRREAPRRERLYQPCRRGASARR